MNTLWGPVSLLCTLAIGSASLDLLFMALLGFVLSARLQLRGCSYALIALGLAAIVRHSFFYSDHLWQLGLEGSMACAFFLTALAFEERAHQLASLDAQVQTGKAALEAAEEERASIQLSAQELQIGFQDKAAALQKELEDLQADHSSILILNEVLRKTTARHIQEGEGLAAKVLDLQREKEEWQSAPRPFHADCSELLKELNAARYEKEQTHLINETLARLYARERFKAKEADQEAASLAEQLAAARKREPLEEKKKHLSEIEPMFKQLKKQFEEKNGILHQVRAELFKTDTELQKVKMEKAALELNPIPEEVEEELQGLGHQIAALEEENQHLQELISLLSDPAYRKKKMKAETPEQEFLF